MHMHFTVPSLIRVRKLERAMYMARSKKMAEGGGGTNLSCTAYRREWCSEFPPTKELQEVTFLAMHAPRQQVHSAHLHRFTS